MRGKSIAAECLLTNGKRVLLSRCTVPPVFIFSFSVQPAVVYEPPLQPVHDPRNHGGDGGEVEGADAVDLKGRAVQGLERGKMN